ncbi:nitrite reductase small subunit NirD [Cellulomonas sp. ATA003]|uniref:nitrite reductase small subunit NirD n=1 Tax=Cellulomonas sp. ATA003 TaxID=3073064 RepID=UPI002873700B|nr:nitrite reductase small subunit NirD [Cellulomonas sp. ATA003]WNB85640.1 nitrite reductase small subunit NirD [Cellulomonas sp. ATA003]
MSARTYVCRLDELDPERGVPALAGGQQVAVFRLADDRVLAVQQRDPYSGANVLSRGIVGSVGERPAIASPMYKQVWDLVTGECLDPAGKEPIPLTAYPVERMGDEVWVLTP